MRQKGAADFIFFHKSAKTKRREKGSKWPQNTLKRPSNDIKKEEILRNFLFLVRFPTRLRAFDPHLRVISHPLKMRFFIA